jgi:hypothetical protein
MWRLFVRFPRQTGTGLVLRMKGRTARPDVTAVGEGARRDDGDAWEHESRPISM